MKARSFVRLVALPLALAAVTALAACTDAGPSAPARLGSLAMTGTLGDTAFAGHAEATLVRADGADTLHLFGAEGPPGMSDLVVYARVAYRGPGVYPLGRGQAGVWHLVGGDVISASFETGESGGTLVVTTDEGDVIEGTLEFAAERAWPPASDRTGVGALYSTATRFTGGVFRAERRTWTPPIDP